MKKVIVLAALGAALFSSAAYAASADDEKWIARCISDNKDEGAKTSVVRVYCECMVDKMPESETRSVTQWEKSHETERKACDKEAGWKETTAIPPAIRATPPPKRAADRP